MQLARAELLGKPPLRRHLGTKVITVEDTADLVSLANAYTERLAGIKTTVKVDGVLQSEEISQIRIVCDNELTAIGNIRS